MHTLLLKHIMDHQQDGFLKIYNIFSLEAITEKFIDSIPDYVTNIK